MPIHTLSKGEWLAYFPHPPKSPDESRFNPIDVNDLLRARFASVSVVVEVDKPWPGIAPLDDQNRIGKVQFSVGRWYIDDVAISRIDERGGDYDIELDRVLETDWVAHILEKAWFYDPTDFFDVLEEARRIQTPGNGPEQLDTLLWEEVNETLRRGDQPAFPSRLQAGKRQYLANRMTPEERDVFCGFLANEGYAFGE
jgi:hypothetical protein